LLTRTGLVAAGFVILGVAVPPFLVPVEGPVTSRFFFRSVPESIFLFDIEHHRGIDFGAPLGTPARAARSGRVVSSSEDPAYGLVVDIRHPLGVVTRYAHLSTVDVREGQWVWRRFRVGRVGMTGRATGPHLHFEIRIGDRSVPPGALLFFARVRQAILQR
jgi:murein DD-endopeptidase MepM/ murein hydrolase activator NlpD